MSTEVQEEKQEDKVNPSEYSCQLILEKTTQEKSKDRSFPSDAFNVTYVVDGQEHLDVIRSGKQANVFDYYYDRYGQGSLKRIDYGHGTVHPNQWGYKAPDKKKKRK